MLKHGKGLAARKSLVSLSLSFLPGAPRARLVVGVRVVYRTAQLFENLLNANGHGAPRFSKLCGEDDVRGMWASLGQSLPRGPSGWPTPFLRDLVVAHPGSTGHGSGHTGAGSWQQG